MPDDNSNARFERIEANLERITERQANNEREIENLRINIESLHTSVSELYASIVGHDQQIRSLRATAERDGENIRALARIAEIHPRRLDNLGGR